MSLSYHELWILQTVIDIGWCWLPVDGLAEPEEPDSPTYWNKPSHGLSITELADILWSLYQHDDIEFKDLRGNANQHPVYLPASVSEIVSMFNPEERYWFCIAAAGVARWEEFAQPNWSRFVDFSGGYHDDIDHPYFSVIATTERRIKTCLRHEVRYSQNRRELTRIAWDTAKTTMLTPWEPYPGKILPRGVSLTVDYKIYPESDRIPGDSEFEILGWSAYWRRREKLYRWYEHGIDDHPDRPQPKI